MLAEIIKDKNGSLLSLLASHFLQKKLKGKSEAIALTGFTLAEVLIVLGLVAIIAAMTLPNLITNTQKNTAATKLEKTYSDLTNCIKRSEVDNGPVANWDFTTNANSLTGSHTFFDTYLSPYFVSPKFCSDGNSATCASSVSGTGINYSLSNGVGFALVLTPNLVMIVVDTNGTKKPNKQGNDRFFFSLTPSNGLTPFGYTKGMTRDQIKDNGTYKCDDTTTATSQHMCTALIYFDGWRILEDYPWKN